MKIYNTLTREKEDFIPLEPGKVRMYVCGVTVYDSCHVGHARAAVVFDIILRVLKASGFEVAYVRNFTDIDDKIIKRSQEVGVDYRTLTSRYEREYLEEMSLLNVIIPTFQPRATQHIEDMCQVIQGLIASHHAYEIEGDVYFRVSSFKDYGKLSKRTLDDLKAGARIAPGEKKENPEDFALWKAAKPEEPSWPCPWGAGRPGWHIECSAMSMKYLGATFDIHGGGSDLIFPHHENEVAQSEAYSGKPFARYWIHNEMIMIEQTKMSKSLGNVFVLRELLKMYAPRIIRYFLISTHYRTPMDFSLEGLNESRQAYERIEAAVARGREYAEGGQPAAGPVEVREWTGEFMKALEDDFNTPKALGFLFRCITTMNQEMDQGAEKKRIRSQWDALTAMLDLLGLKTDTDRFKKIVDQIPLDENRVQQVLARGSLAEEDVAFLVKSRESARRSRLWKLADEIRSRLQAGGVEIQDERDGSKVIRP